MKTQTKLYILLCFITLNTYAGRVIEHEVTYEKIKRHYNVYLPDSWKEGQKLPLVVAFHPFKNSLDLYMKVSKLQPYSEQYNHIIAYPAAATGIWNNGHLPDEKPYDDVGLVKIMLKEIQEQYGYDPKKVYSYGYSSGGFMSYRMGAELQDTFAATAVIGGAIEVPITPETTKPQPLIIFHGLVDLIVPLNGKKGLIGSKGAYQSIEEWMPVNKVKTEPVKSSGRLTYLNDKVGMPYFRYLYEPKKDSNGEIIDFYVLPRAGHMFPLSMQFQPNQLIFEFFAKYSNP